MNILFVNYGDFTSNSLNHIAGFARTLTELGHACIVAVPQNPGSIKVVPDPSFQPAVFGDLLQKPAAFPDGRPADLIHAWTPRELVRRFVLAYQPFARARLVVHLEDNEVHLLAAWLKCAPEEALQLGSAEFSARAPTSLSHPRRARLFLEASDGITYITPSLSDFVPSGKPGLLLPPGVDFSLYRPQEPDPDLRTRIGLKSGDKVIVFTGSATFANESEVRDLYSAVEILANEGIPIRLIRTGFNPPAFHDSLPENLRARVIDLGFQPKTALPALLALADVLVQPGRPGPFNDFRLPSKIPEYLAMGKPVVLPASNIGRQLQNGIDALVLREGSPAEMALACRHVLGDRRLARALGENALAVARRCFDPAANGRSLAQFYTEVAVLPSAPGSTTGVAAGTSEISLRLRTLAAGRSEAADLAAELVPLVEEIERLDPQRAEVERLDRELRHWQHHYDLAHQHAGNLAKNIEGLKDRIRSLEEQLRTEVLEARLRADTVETLNESLAPQTERLGRDLDASLRTRNEAVAKVRAMQESFSWKVTTPLRLLRRTLVDPWRRTDRLSVEAPLAGRGFARATFNGVTLWYSVDHPQSWTLPPGPITLRGWCFADDGRKLGGIRALISDRVATGSYGFKRLDVVAAVRTKSQAEYSGWKIPLDLAPADRRLDLEVQDEAGNWHRFFRAALSVRTDVVREDATSYERWIELYDQPTPAALQRQADLATGFLRHPRVSIVVPVYNTPERWLTRAIDSVRAQTYGNWELCLADDASTAPHVRPLLEAAAASDPRIKIVLRPQNGHISAASNSALALATGEFVALLDHDDELAPNALFEVVALVNQAPDADYIYSDEDKIDENGRRHEPYFKPDFLPDLFLGQNYTCHLSVYRASLLREAGGFRVGFEGSQDWDLALRVIERTTPARIHHIPRILYHWRAIPGSTALLLSEKNYPVEAARRALQDHFDRAGRKVELIAVPGDHWRVRFPLPPDPPLVSLVIPTRNHCRILSRCIDSILEKTDYPEFELIVVDNDSNDPATLEYLERLASGSHPLLRSRRHRARVLRHPGAFNYSAINNRAVKEAAGGIVGLLNNDLEVINADWLQEMVSQALRPEIGAVGAMLYYQNETIQHAGIVLGLGGVAGHAFREFARGTEGKFNRVRLVQNYSAVTAACLLVRKAVYEQVGGLDERELAVAFNDVDFCLKVRAAGYRNLWTPFAEFYHHESISRGADDTPDKQERFRLEIETMKRRWGPLLASDPAYNPNLTLETNDFTLAAVPRLPQGRGAARPATIP